jgi:isopenicillin-N N-acyltransferase-like protein
VVKLHHNLKLDQERKRMPETVTRLKLSGSHEEIGFAHGLLLKQQVRRNIEFYKALFLARLGDESRILKSADFFRKAIKSYNPEFAVEIDSIALGAGISEPLWLYALNARTELTLAGQINECTAVAFPEVGLIGQTWDWAESLLDNFVIMQIDLPSGISTLQLTEAGIIGKIGMNNLGLGVTLNIHWVPGIHFSGIPVHILLRAVLESGSLDEAKNAIYRSGGGKASNLIVCQGGSGFDVEFYGEGSVFHKIEDPAYVHTNHLIHARAGLQVESTNLAGSIARFDAVKKAFATSRDYSRKKMVSILSECPGGEGSVLACYKPDIQSGLGYIGTLATVVMDLSEKRMYVRKGNPSLDSFSIRNFIQYSI